MKAMYICQLSKEEKLRYYKAIKAYLIREESYSLENLQLAMDEKIKDIQDLLFQIHDI